MPRAAVPSAQELKGSGASALEAAKNSGVVVSPESFEPVVSGLKAKLEDLGYDPELHPLAAIMLKRFDTAAEGPQSFRDLHILRQKVANVSGSANKQERMLGQTAEGRARRPTSEVYVRLTCRTGAPRPQQASAAFKAGLDAYARGSKADIIADLLDRAGVDARSINQSGNENAIRAQFRQLYKNKAKIRLFNPEERAMIRDVAAGGPLSLRLLGMLAPRGVVSAGVGAVIGHAALGPFGAPIVWGAGETGRRLADRSMNRAVERASEFVRSGGAVKAPATKPIRRSPLAVRAALARGLLLQGGSGNGF